MKHHLARYEDWDWKIRLAAHPTPWLYSGIVGINYRNSSAGLSKKNPLVHGKYQYNILMSEQDLIKDFIGKRGFWLAMSKVTIRTARSLFGIRSKLSYLRIGLGRRLPGSRSTS
jgi:hypothetical protein